jgi:hypothetical protein
MERNTQERDARPCVVEMPFLEHFHNLTTLLEENEKMTCGAIHNNNNNKSPPWPRTQRFVVSIHRSAS